MAVNITLGVRLDKTGLKRIELDNVQLDSKVALFRQAACEKIGKSKQEIDLIYAGLLLEDESVLSSYGISAGVMVHVLERKAPHKVRIPKKLTEQNVQDLVSTIRSSCSKGSLQRLHNPDEMRAILQTLPDSAAYTADPVVIALVRDPALYTLLSDPATLRRVANRHPAIVEVAEAVSTYLVKQQAAGGSKAGTTGAGSATGTHSAVGGGTSGTSAPTGNSSGYTNSYTLDGLSDNNDDEVDDDNDEDMGMMPAPGGSQMLAGGGRGSLYNAITAAQLASAIASATYTSNRPVVGANTTAGLNPVTAGLLGGGNNTLITPEMFTNAMQQAFASAAGGVVIAPPPAGSAGNTSTEESIDGIRTRLQPQLQQMREMGLVNENDNLRALQATGGDLQAAIGLVFSALND